MKVIWLPQAKKQLLQTARYIFREFGQRARNKFIHNVQDTIFLLADNPYLGPAEPLLANRTTKYRSCNKKPMT